MGRSSVLFVLMLMISSLGAGCIGERILHKFADDDKDITMKFDCDEIKYEALHEEIRITEEELSEDRDNEELQAKLEKLTEELRFMSRACMADDRTESDEERTNGDDDSRDEKCYDENRQEVECEDSENSNDEEREEEKCYDENRQEVECEDSSESN